MYENAKSSLQTLDDIDFCSDTSTVFREPKSSQSIAGEFYIKKEENRIGMNTSTSLENIGTE